MPATLPARPYPVEVEPRPESDPRRAESFDEELLEAESTVVETYLDDAKRIERVDEELAMGFSALAHVGKAVSIFGSARTPTDHRSTSWRVTPRAGWATRASRSSRAAAPG
jgi:hypothetical protein